MQLTSVTDQVEEIHLFFVLKDVPGISKKRAKPKDKIQQYVRSTATYIHVQTLVLLQQHYYTILLLYYCYYYYYYYYYYHYYYYYY